MGNKLDLRVIEKYGIKLRLVDLQDAEFILKLRTNDSLAKHLSPTSTSISDQMNWIKDYKEREKNQEEYYFITENTKGDKFGTTRLSDFDSNCFELGSWLFSPDAPQGTSIKADLITKEIGFDLLNFEICKFNVRKKNRSVLKYHFNYKPIIVHEDEENIYFNLTKENFNNIKHRLLKFL